MKYTITQDFSVLQTEAYLNTYKSQFKIHQDYFHHPSFQYTCASVFAETTKCLLFSAFKGEKLIGYMAFRTEAKKMRYFTYSFLVPMTENIAEYNYPITDRQYTEPVLKLMDEALQDYNLYLPQMPAYFKHLVCKNIQHTFVRYSIGNPMLLGAEEMLNAANKRTLKKNKRQLERKHSIEVEHLTEGISEELLDTFYDIHIERWKRVGVKSLFLQERFKSVYKKIAQLNIEGVGESMLCYYKVDGQILSMDFGYLFKDHYLVQIAATKQNDITSSAGSLLNKESLEYMGTKNIEKFDLGVGVEDYKIRYTNHINTFFTLVKIKNKWHRLFQRINLK